MKIPIILAQEPVAVPTAPRYGGVSETGLAELGRGLGQVSQALGDVAKARQDLQTKSEVQSAKAEFELGLATLDSDLRVSERDPNAYVSRSEAGAKDLRRRVSERLTNADSRALFEAAAPGLLVNNQVAVLKHRNTLFIEQQEGALTRTLDQRKTLAGLSALDKPEDFVRQYREAVTVITDMEPLLGAKRAEELRIKTRQEFLDARAFKHKETDPEGFIAQAETTYAGLDPKQRDVLVKGALDKIDREERRRLAEDEKREKEAVRMLAEGKKLLVTDLEAEAAAGTLTLETLELRREMRQLDPDDYRRLRKDIAEGGIQRPSDPAILSAVALDVAALRPRSTEADINRLHAAYLDRRPGLNLKDAQSQKEKLTTKLRVLENEGESDLVRDHNQAEQTIRAALGIRPGLIVEALKDDPAGRLYFAGLDELSRRSRLFQKSYGGTEDPLTVAAELIPRLQKAFGQASQLRINELTLLLRYPTPQALEQAFQAGQISQTAYQLEKQRFLEQNRLRQQIAPPMTEPGAKPKPAEAKPRL